MLPKETILGHYRLLQRIGLGGMGEVYVAEDTRIARQVAIKIVRTEPQPYPDSEATQEASRLFRREMKAIAMLDHRNILSVIEHSYRLHLPSEEPRGFLRRFGVGIRLWFCTYNLDRYLACNARIFRYIDLAHTTKPYTLQKAIMTQYRFFR